MFGTNKIVGQKQFSGNKGELVVTSIFRTLQGEGPLAGTPAVFLRLTHCNLNCSFCDTYFEAGERYSFIKILNEMLFCISPGANYRIEDEATCVITGGEPMLQKEIGPFCHYVAPHFRFIQIESNGICYQEIPDAVVLVVSPKCHELGGVPVRYLKPNEKTLERADCLKFVLTADPLSPYHEVPSWAFEWKRSTGREIYVSPMAVYKHPPNPSAKEAQDMAERVRGERVSFWENGLYHVKGIQRNHEWAAAYCMSEGLRMSMQMHLFASIP